MVDTTYVDRSPLGRLARAASYVLNSLSLPAFAVAIALAHLGAGRAEIMIALGVFLAAFCIVPLLVIIWMLWHHETSSLDVPERSKRTGPFVIGTLSGLLAYVTILNFDLDQESLLLGSAIVVTSSTVFVAIINLFWKISVHVVGMSGSAGLLAFVGLVLPPVAIPVVGPAMITGAALFIPFMMWARVYLGAHTRWQTVAGAVLGLVVTFGGLYLLWGTGRLTIPG